ncbi:exonuclease SbcC [Psychromonas sp. SA13A]|uniref:exonuclease SbcC n=1 Tax=Psychromonas sp. SA13A TaxID=2686346 RepID=UPI00140B57EF|nr:exonuclease SbcC [Psychromonas sp. SA13A]
MASSILINQLIVVGIRKNYTVNFRAGVNIIYGDSATGKSSILNLIDYLLGAKRFLLYPEIISTGRYAVLDVTLNDFRCSIKRDIFDPAKPIEVYPCSFDKIEQFAANKYLPSFNPISKYPEMEFFSEFLINSLNLTNLKIKQSPKKDESSLARLSFRDLIKYCYVNQDDLGSKNYLNPDNYVLQTRNAEVFKYIFNALDSQVSELEQNISEKTKQMNILISKYTTVSEFLRESEFGDMQKLDKDIDKIDDEVILIQESISELNNRVIADNDVFRAIKSVMAGMELDKSVLKQKAIENEQKIEKFSRLQNNYLVDIKKFNSTLASREFIGEIPDELSLCPVCDNSLDLKSAKQKFEIASAEKVNQEINSLKRKVKDTEHLINESRKQWEFNKLDLKQLEVNVSKAREAIELNTKELTSPYLAERDMHVKQLGEVQQRRKEFVSRLKVRNQHNYLRTKIKSLESAIIELKIDLEKLTENTPSMADVISNLSVHLKNYLQFIKIKDPSGISLTSDKFVPVVRGVEYGNIPSGGLRTIVGIGYLCSLMEEALVTEMSYPSFLMIDTVGKYLGKTKTHSKYTEETSQGEDSHEGVSDPLKYQNIFEYIINISDQYEQQQRICQFILVDNDVPDHIIDELSGFIVAQFSSERIDGLPVGFIDDATV